MSRKKKQTPKPAPAAAPTSEGKPSPGALRRELAELQHQIEYGPDDFGWKHAKPGQRAAVDARIAEITTLLS